MFKKILRDVLEYKLCNNCNVYIRECLIQTLKMEEIILLLFCSVAYQCLYIKT